MQAGMSMDAWSEFRQYRVEHHVEVRKDLLVAMRSLDGAERVPAANVASVANVGSGNALDALRRRVAESHIDGGGETTAEAGSTVDGSAAPAASPSTPTWRDLGVSASLPNRARVSTHIFAEERQVSRVSSTAGNPGVTVGDVDRKLLESFAAARAAATLARQGTGRTGGDLLRRGPGRSGPGIDMVKIPFN